LQGKANFRGHPLHLMLISFPVAFWSGTLATDALGHWTADVFWYRMSVALIAMGTLTGVLASIFGYVDYLTAPMPRKAKRIATLHMFGSLATLVVFPLAFVLRRTDHASTLGIALTVAGALVLLVAGYWGSELAVRYGVGLPER
jgi:uncharacterized membrane protein